MDILPNSCNTVVNCGGVKIFVEKIQHIEYIDVAEQAIKVYSTIQLNLFLIGLGKDIY